MKPTFKFTRREDGSLLTPGNLPPPDTERWVMRRKADIVMAVACGILTMEAACERYRLSREELLGWQRTYELYGLHGLSGRGSQLRHKMRKAEKLDDKGPAQKPNNGASAMPMSPPQYKRA